MSVFGPFRKKSIKVNFSITAPTAFLNHSGMTSMAAWTQTTLRPRTFCRFRRSIAHPNKCLLVLTLHKLNWVLIFSPRSTAM